MLPRNVPRKNKKHGLCDRFRTTVDDHRDHEARYGQNFSLEQADVEMHERQKNDDKLRQSSTLITIYVGIEPIGVGQQSSVVWRGAKQVWLNECA